MNAMAMKWCLGRLVVVLSGALVGCEWSEPGGLAGLWDEDLVVEALPGMDAGGEDGRFAEGFVLRAGPWEVDEVWVVDGERVTWGWLDYSVKAPGRVGQWRGKSWVLSLDEKQEVRRCLDEIKEKLGYRYINTRIVDGLRLELFATPDAKGPVVLVSSNAGIKPLDALFERLNRPVMTGSPRELPLLEDVKMVAVFDRAVRY